MVVFWYWMEAAEQTAAFAIGTGCEERRVGSPGFAAVTEGQGPQPIYDHRIAISALEQAAEVGFRIKTHNGTIAEVAYQQLAGVPAEGAGRQSHAPGRIDLMQFPSGIRAGRHAMKRSSVRVKDVDKAVSATSNIIVFRIVLLGKGHEDHAVNGLDVERRIPGGRVRIRELRVQSQISAIRIYRAFSEIGQ